MCALNVHDSERKILRPRLDQALSGIFQHPLTAVAAPGGYGKSTAVRDYLGRQNTYIIWLRLFWDRDLNACFWDELVSAVRRHAPAAAERLRCMGPPQTQSGCAKAADILESVSEDRELVFVLDNYDRVETPSLNKLLQFLLQRFPDRFPMVMIGRHLPQFVLHGYLLGGHCRIIDKDTLRLDQAEIADLAELLDRKYDPQELQWITEYTGGWLSFAYFLLSESRRRGLNRFFVSQLSARIYAEVLKEQLSTQERDMLLVLSRLETFTPEQAAVILGTSEADRLDQRLDKLSTDTVFLAKTAAGYAIQGGALEFLQAEARKSDSPLVRLGERSLVRWYLDSGRPGDAIRLLYERDDLNGILQLLEEHTVERISESEEDILLKAFRDMNFSQLSDYPVAAVQIAFLLLKTDAYAETGKHLLLELKHHALTVEHPSYSRDYILGQIELALSSSMDKRLRAASIIELVREQSQGGHAKPAPWIVPSLLCGFHHTSGSMWAEVESFKALCTEQDTSFSAPVKCSNILQAEYFLETGELGKATYYALEGIPEGSQRRHSLLSVCAYFILAKATLLNGDREKARALLAHLDTELRGIQDDRLTNMADVCKGYVYACMGEYQQVPQWIYGSEKNSRRLCQYSSYAYIIKAKELAHQRDFLGFELMSRDWAVNIRNSGNLLAEIHYHIKKSLAARVLYGMPEAVGELRTAFSLALPDGIAAPFVENGEHLLPILQHAMENRLLDLPRQYVELLNKLMSSFLGRTVDILGEGAALTHREKEILQLLNQGLNYREIAECLIISQFTVRKHIQNIYAKLNVSDRVNALIRAREIFTGC